MCFCVISESKNLLNKNEVGNIFLNIESIVGVNDGFLKDLIKLQSEGFLVSEIGPTILKWVNQFKIYASYCANQPYIVPKIDALRAANPAFSTFVAECMHRNECRGLPLTSYLMKPIQRICKYPLLIKELLKSTEPTHQDYEPLNDALTLIKGIVDQINERTRQVENYKKIEEIQNNVANLPKGLELNQLNRFLLKDGPVKFLSKKGKAEDGYLFIFSDFYLEAKQRKDPGKYKYVKHTLLGTLSARDVGETNIELYHGAVYENAIQLPSREEKNLWLEVLQKAITKHGEKTQEHEMVTKSIEDLRADSARRSVDTPKEEHRPSPTIPHDPRKKESNEDLMEQVRILTAKAEALEQENELLRQELEKERTLRRNLELHTK